MTKIYDYESWEDFTGYFFEEDGYDAESVEKHMKVNFFQDQFKVYKFALFERVGFRKTGFSYKFNFLKLINIGEEENNDKV